jgi:hypothetical protein
MESVAGKRRGVPGWVAPATFAVVYIFARLAVAEFGWSTPVKVVIAVLPVPAFVWLVIEIVRGVRQMDELERRIQLEALAVAFPLAMTVMMTLGLLELAIPLSKDDWSYRHVWAFFPLFYVGGLIIARKRYQ